MLDNLLQVSKNSMPAKQHDGCGRASSSKDSYQFKNEPSFGQADTHHFHNEKHHSNEMKDFGGLKNELEQTQILIAEAENELLVLFREYLSSKGLRTDTTDKGNDALERFMNRKNKEKPYDAVVLDTHLQSSSGLEIAKKIHIEKPHQKIVLVTTTPKENLPRECLKAAGINDENILIMPFRLSKLVSVVKN